MVYGGTGRAPSSCLTCRSKASPATQEFVLEPGLPVHPQESAGHELPKGSKETRKSCCGTGNAINMHDPCSHVQLEILPAHT